jgi:phosphoglycolate phosphatase
LFEAARRMKVDPAHCVYVGDDERDIVAGHAAGMRTVAATYGYLGSHGDVKGWNAHVAIEFPSQLLKCLV